MKSKCQWPDCGQKIEHDATLANTKIVCPSCNRDTYLTPEPDLKRSFLSVLKSIFTPLYSIYFDVNAVKPGAASPYKFVLSFARAIYLFFAVLFLIAFVLVLLQLKFVSASDNGTSVSDSWYLFVATHPRIVGTLALAYVWVFVYWAYKITRVLFDIAEYLRQIASK